MGLSSMSVSVGLLLLCINVAYSTNIAVTSDAAQAFSQVQSGSKTIAVFTLDDGSLNLVKSSSADFSSLVTDLVAAKKAGQCRYAIVSTKANQENKLIFFAWMPQSASVTQRNTYKEEADDVIEALGADIFVLVNTGSQNDLDLSNIVESGLAGYNVIESSDYTEYIKETIESKVTVTVDSNAESSFSRVVQGTSYYIIFRVSSDFTTITVDKVAARGAGFDDLVADLQGSTTPKFGVFATNVNLGGKSEKKYIVIDWIPGRVSDENRVKLRSLVPQLSVALKTPFFFELATSSVDDLDLDKILNMALGGKVQTPSGHVEFNLNPGAVGAVNDLTRGSIRYALFKFAPDLSSIVVDKVAPLKSNFNNFVDDLIAAQNDKEPRYTLYLAPFKFKGQVVQKIISILWTPFNVPTKLQTLYKTNFQTFKVLTKASLLLDFNAQSVGDLNLDAILKVALGKDYEGQGNLGGNLLGEVNENIPDVKFDVTGVNGVKQLLQGMKRYAIFSLNNGKAVLEKLADFKTSFDNLKADLLNAQKLGQPKYAIFMAPVSTKGKTELRPLFITWVPLNVPNKLRLLYLQSGPKFKLALGVDFWFEFTAVTLNDLELGGLIKTGQQQSLLKLSLGGLTASLGGGLLNPLGVIGSVVGTAGNVVGGLAGTVLGLAQGVVGGVVGLGSSLIQGLLGGVLGGKGGLLGGLLGGQGGLLGGLLGGGNQQGGGGLLGGVLGGGSQSQSQSSGGGFLGGFLGSGNSNSEQQSGGGFLFG